MRLLAIAVMTVCLSGCLLLEKESRPSDAFKTSGPPVVRAYFLDEQSCPQASEETIAAKIVTSAIGFVVDKSIDAVVEAANDDKEALTLTGSHPDLLFYRTSKNAKFDRRDCVAIVVAPRLKGGEFCQPIEAWPKGMCNEKDPESNDAKSVKLWKDIGLGVPAFFAKVDFIVPTPGVPVGYRTPQLTQLYYPHPLANREASKVEGLTITLKAALPSKSNVTLGDSAFEIVITGEGLTPSREFQFKSLGHRGLWMKIPEIDEKTSGELYSNPVNLVATLTETPNVTKWLQKVATYVEKNRADIKTKVDERVNPYTIAAAEEAAESKDKADAVTAATACATFIGSLEASRVAAVAATTAGQAINKDDPATSILADSKKAAATVAKAKCSSDKLKAQSLNSASPLCGISREAEAEAGKFCP